MQGGIDKNAYMPIIKLYKTLASKKYHSLSRQISVFFVMFIRNMSVQICRATQSFHSLKRRAPLPSRSAASNSALVGASMPTCRRGNNFETVQKGNLMQCNAMHCNTMPSLERYLCKCTNLGQKKQVLLLQKKKLIEGLIANILQSN